MVTSKDCLTKYGEPGTKNKFMLMWDVPQDVHDAIPVIPKKIFCNRDLTGPFEQALHNLIDRGFAKELRTWDGCFNIRPMRNKKTGYSLHSWGIAVDLNAADNPLNVSPDQGKTRGLKPFSKGFVKCFTDAGFDWGGDWKVPIDGMHFQLSKI